MIDISSFTAQLPFEGAFAVAEIASLSPDALGRLNNEQKHELETFTNVKRQQEYVTSRLLLGQLAKKLGAHEDEFSVYKDDLGRPFGKFEATDYYVSIAHTRNYVFCGITKDRAIGVDIEPAGRNISDRLKQRLLHQDEEKNIRNMDTIRLWTLKESFLKLVGSGLRQNMSDVCINRKRETFFVELNDDKRAKIISFRSEKNWMAIAYFQQNN